MHQWNLHEALAQSGVYQRDCRSIPSSSVLTELYCRFDGGHWYQGRLTVAEAGACTIKSEYSRLPWRTVATAALQA